MRLSDIGFARDSSRWAAGDRQFFTDVGNRRGKIGLAIGHLAD